MKKFQLIKERWIGEGEPPLIIAEIASNHNGDLQIAFDLIEKAKMAGADAVKFQVKDIELAFDKELLDKSYTGPNSFGETYREHKLALEFSEDVMKKIYQFAQKVDIMCFSTPFDVNSVELLEKIGNPIYKIASMHVSDLTLIEKIAKTKKPILMSTGMSSIEEIEAAVNLIRKYTDKLALFQCTACYPTDEKDVNLRVIPTLRNRFDCPVGYSGHERGTSISVAAVSLNASMIERHFTLDRTMKGSDHASSVEFNGLKLIAERSKAVFNALGSDKKFVLDCELDFRKKFRGY
jgi:sialic acid synthase SpsE